MKTKEFSISFVLSLAVMLALALLWVVGSGGSAAAAAARRECPHRARCHTVRLPQRL